MDNIIDDQNQNKISPKLRMVANANSVVNTIRAELSPALSVKDERLLNQLELQRSPAQKAVPLAEVKDKAKRGKMTAEDIPDQIFVNVYVGLTSEADNLPETVRHRRPRRKHNLLSVAIPLDKLAELQKDPSVSYIEIADRIVFDEPVSAAPQKEEPLPLRWKEKTADLHKDGEGVLIGIIDVQGFDFSHPDFLDDKGETRFVAIWDQGGSHRDPPEDFSYGAEITQEQMNAALKEAAKGVGAAAYHLEPQSQMARGSHGTHVAGIAAGNHGICSKADIAAVLISLPDEDSDSRSNFYDSTHIADAIDYLFKLGEKLGEKKKEKKRPVSINISLGTNGHAHDASSSVSRWLDFALVTPGRSVCVAAGNAGQEAAVAPGDMGFTSGRIHTSGRIPAAGLIRDIEWVVFGDGLADISENELEIWYSPQDQFVVHLRPPGSNEWIGPVKPNEFIENRMLDDGTFVSIYNERYWPANGSNLIGLYLSPFFSEHGVVGVKAGTWVVRLTGLQVRDGSYHGWIERDDPRRLKRTGNVEGWSFPSFFSENSNVDNSSVSSLACGQRVIAVANLDEVNECVNITSSQGPTRDNRLKPEIAAHGTNVIAANGFDPQNPWVKKTGTSMASPYVAGVVGLMLAAQPMLTAAQIGGILQRTAQPLPNFDFTWQNDAGFGRICPAEAIEEAYCVTARRDLTDDKS
jgi:subtilisin family serine protease